MKKQAGFTLIEIIASLIIVGILTAIAGMGIVQMVRGYTTTRENARITEQAQLAIARITKEIIELMGIPTASTATSLYIRNINGNRSLGLDAAQKIRINDTGGAITSGDILIEGVNAFTLTYYWGSNPVQSGNSWTPAQDIRLLTFIDVNLSLNRPGGGNPLPFAARVTPRNNKNTGGYDVTSGGASWSPPAAPLYPHCFIATASYGNAYHPMVIVLKDFRDRFLLSWEGGRFLVRLYYAFAPRLAEQIKENPTAMLLARIILCPVTLFALFMLYAPLALVLAPLLALLLAAMCIRRHRLRARMFPVHSPKGSILLSLILTILIMGVLAAAMLPIFSSSKFSQVYADQGAKAYFLAESGFRYATSEYANASGDAAKFNVLTSLNRKTCTLLNNDGSIFLIVYPYWYRTSAATSTTLTVQLPGEFDTSVSLPTTGYLKINNLIYTYTGSSGGTSGSSVLTFTGFTTALPPLTTATDVYNAVQPSGTQTVTRKANINLSPTGVSILPQINGNFTVGSSTRIYTYEKRSGNTLYSIDLADPSMPWTDLPLSATTTIVLEKYLRLSSTGSLGGNNREILYNVPTGLGKDWTQVRVHDPMNTMANWSAPSPGSGFGGTHIIQSIDGSSAMKVDSAPSTGSWWTNTGNWAVIFFNWGNTEADLYQSWFDNNGTLSYDLQVKVRNDQPSFFAGIDFRARNNTDQTDLYTYGISFLKARYQLLSTDISPALIPGYNSWNDKGPLFDGDLETSGLFGYIKYSKPAIVLWQRTSTGFKWLAYRILTAADGIVTYNSSTYAYRLVNWSTLMVRVSEGYSLAFNNGGGTSGTGVPIKSGDTIATSNGSKSARVVGTPILTGGSWASRNAQGTFILGNNANFASGDILYVNGVQRARANGAQSATKQNYFRVYYTRPTSQGTANAIQTDNNRLANPRDSVNWPPDDLTNLTAANDYVTMIGGSSGLQWTGYNTGVSSLTSTSEPNAIIPSADLVSPAWIGPPLKHEDLFQSSQQRRGQHRPCHFERECHIDLLRRLRDSVMA